MIFDLLNLITGWTSWVILVSSFIVYYAIVVRNSKAAKFMAKVGGPPKIPIFGNSLQLNLPNDKITQRVQIEWPKMYGPRYVIALGSRKYFTSFLFSDVEKLLNSTVHLEKGDEYKFINPWLGDGLLLSRGEKWYKRRKLLTPTFHFRILEDFMQVFNEQSKTMVQILGKDSSGSKTDLDICHYITTCALDIICETAMGKKINAQMEKDSEYVNAIYRVSALLQYRSIRPWLQNDFIWRLSAAGKEEKTFLEILHGFTYRVIEEKKSERKAQELNTEKLKTKSTEDNSDDVFMSKDRKKIVAFLDLLLQTQAENPGYISDLDIREETDTFMFEGHDTTAASLSWTVFLLGCNPDKQQLVYEELQSIFGDDKERRPVTTQDLTKMKYLECCIKESLRLYPSVPFIARRLKSDLELEDGLVVPAGFNFCLFPMQIHRNPKVYPDPEKFKPERFFPENSAGRHPFAYIPFSAGPRNCIGQKFALMEEKVILANLLRAFRIESIEKPEDIVIMTEIILRPRDGLYVKLHRR